MQGNNDIRVISQSKNTLFQEHVSDHCVLSKSERKKKMNTEFLLICVHAIDLFCTMDSPLSVSDSAGS